MINDVDVHALKRDLEKLVASLAPRRWPWVLLSFVAGATLVYFGDPEKGRERRSALWRGERARQITGSVRNILSARKAVESANPPSAEVDIH